MTPSPRGVHVFRIQYFGNYRYFMSIHSLVSVLIFGLYLVSFTDHMVPKKLFYQNLARIYIVTSESIGWITLLDMDF